MLNWWLGKSVERSRGGDEDPEFDLPETPAPVFAARALKSAIFGTPAVHGDETICEEPENASTMPRKDLAGAQPRSLSPTKLPGILLTPGTAAARRKTVSFGAEVLEKQEKNLEKEGVESVPRNCPGKFSSPWSAKEHTPARTSRKTALTKSLEQARENKPRQAKARRASNLQSLVDVENDADSERPAKSKSEAARTTDAEYSNQDLMKGLPTNSEADGDVTVDLNEPRSHSGRYWKSEYESYHEEARSQMQKLVRYKKLAKSFAKMKDSQAIELAEQLKEEQRRVVSMEDKISKLSAQVAATGINGIDDQAPELITELAKRTALAVQYRGEVEEFREALEGDRMAKEISAAQARETKEAKAELKRLRDEMQNLRESLSATERANGNLHEENQKLGQELEHVNLRHEKHMRKCEKRQQSNEEVRQKKEDAYQRLQEDYEKLKESAKSQRRDAEHLLKQRHEQVVGLKKELAAKCGVESTVEELQRTLQNRINEHERIVADFHKQIAQLKDAKRNQANDGKEAQPSKSRTEDMKALQRPRTNTGPGNSPFRDSLIPIPSQPTVRVSMAAASATTFSQPRSNSTAPRPRSCEAVLTDITNSASPDSPPRRPPGPVQHTPYATRTFDASIGSPSMTFPSPEPSMFQTTGHERKYQPSPRPSMFSIAASPPKPTGLQNRRIDDAAERQKANLPSSRLSSMDGSRVRNPLPPDRAAAAKARLGQKMVEKKKGQGPAVGKENVRSRVV